MITASIRRTADGRSYRVEFPFDRDVVAGIKQLVPAHSRTYDPDERAWYIAPAYRDVIRQLLEDVFIVVEMDTETSTTDSTSGPDEYTALHLLPSTPRELVEAAYKCLSRLHHPDRGGDTAKMQAINEAVSVLRRRLAS